MPLVLGSMAHADRGALDMRGWSERFLMGGLRGVTPGGLSRLPFCTAVTCGGPSHCSTTHHDGGLHLKEMIPPHNTRAHAYAHLLGLHTEA